MERIVVLKCSLKPEEAPLLKAVSRAQAAFKAQRRKVYNFFVKSWHIIGRPQATKQSKLRLPCWVFTPPVKKVFFLVFKFTVSKRSPFASNLFYRGIYIQSSKNPRNEEGP